MTSRLCLKSWKECVQEGDIGELEKDLKKLAFTKMKSKTLQVQET